MLKIQMNDTYNGNTVEREIKSLVDIERLIAILFAWYEGRMETSRANIQKELDKRGIENIEDLFGTYDEAQELLRCSHNNELCDLSDVAEYIEGLKDQIDNLQSAMQDIYDIADDNRG